MVRNRMMLVVMALLMVGKQAVADFTVYNKTGSPVAFAVLYSEKNHTKFDLSSTESAVKGFGLNDEKPYVRDSAGKILRIFTEPLVVVIENNKKIYVRNLEKRSGYDRDLVYSLGTNNLVQKVTGNKDAQHVFLKNLGSTQLSHYVFSLDSRGDLQLKTSAISPNGKFATVENPFALSFGIPTALKGEMQPALTTSRKPVAKSTTMKAPMKLLSEEEAVIKYTEPEVLPMPTQKSTIPEAPPLP